MKTRILGAFVVALIAFGASGQSAVPCTSPKACHLYCGGGPNAGFCFQGMCYCY
jgi:hypothetical protein